MSGSDWLRGIVPPVPAEFASRLALLAEEVVLPAGTSDLPSQTGALPGPDYLMDSAMVALARALSPEGRERGGAFDLLGADAFATWAAEAGLDLDDPEAKLVEMTKRLAEGPEVQ